VNPLRHKTLHALLVAAGSIVVLGIGVVIAVDLVPRLLPILTEPTPAGSQVHTVFRDLSRMLGVTLSMLVALCAIAIPLTANVYTPKLIELFVADRGNRVALGYYVLANAFVLWNGFVVFDGGTESARLRVFVCLVLAVGGLLLIVPYCSYVLQFLIPGSIIERLQTAVLVDVDRATALTNADELSEARQETLDTIQYLGKIVLRSVDRYDRDTVFQGLSALETVFDAYQAKKPYLPEAWYNATREEMRGLTPEVIRETRRQKAGIEVAIMAELSLILSLSMGRLPEVVARVAHLTRRFGVRATERGDLGAREQVTLFFNTFLRTALQRRHSDTFYKFVYQYRRFAEAILEADPSHVRRIAFFLDYYGHQAARMGMGYLINVVAYDLAALCELAYEKKASCRQAIVDTFIELDRDSEGLMEMPGVIKAQIKLAAKLRQRGEPEPSSALVDELRKVPRDRLQEAFAQIISARDEHFWEIADRRRHLDHVEAEFRPAVDAIRAELLGASPSRGRKTMEFRRRALLRTRPPRGPPTPPAPRSPRRSCAPPCCRSPTWKTWRRRRWRGSRPR
jgi:hypothetical protein